MSRVLLVSSGSGSRGGGEIMLAYLAAALAGRGHQIVSWVPAHARMDELAQRLSACGEVVRAAYRNTYDRPLRCLGQVWDRAEMARRADEWRALAPDVIHLNKQNLEDGLDLAGAAAGSGLPCLATIHLTQTARQLGAAASGLRDWAARRALNRFPGWLVAVETSRAADLRRWLGSVQAVQRVRLCENGIPRPPRASPAERERMRADLGAAEGGLLALAVGRLVPQKRPDVFLRWAKAAETWERPSSWVWIGGRETEEAWDAMVRREGLAGRVRRVPWVADPLPYYRAADLLVHSGAYEGLPLAWLEAMAHGLPVAVAADLLASIRSLGPHDVIPVAVASGIDEAEIAPAGMQRRSEISRRLYAARFSAEAMAERYERLYQEAQAAFSPDET